MKRISKALVAVSFIALGLASVAHAGWLHQSNSVLQAQKAQQRHPLGLDQMIVNPYDAANYSVCVVYATGAKQNSKGRVVTKVRVFDAEDNVKKRMKIAVNVNNGRAFGCKDAQGLEAGDVVRFNHRLKKMPPLKIVNGEARGVAITGVISTGGRPKIGDGPLALKPPTGKTPRGLLPGEKGGWFTSANSVFHSNKKNTTHPTVMSQVIEVPRDTGPRPLLCSAYNSADGVAKDKGQVLTTVTISYPNGDVLTIELEGEVADRVYTACEKADRKLRRGTIVAFEHKLSGMPKLDRNQYGDLVGAISSTGEPTFRTVFDGGTGGGGGGGGGGEIPDGPPVPGSIFVAADHYAITTVLSKRHYQLRRQKNDRPAKYVIVGPHSVPDPARHGYNFDSTTGNGATPAEAWADYQRKHGAQSGSGRLLSDSERRDMEWFHLMSSSGGPTGFRVDSIGKLHGDVYRPSFGVKAGGPFSSIGQTINFFQALGL